MHEKNIDQINLNKNAFKLMIMIKKHFIIKSVKYEWNKNRYLILNIWSNLN